MVSMVRNASPKNQSELLELTGVAFSPMNRIRKRVDEDKCCRAWGTLSGANFDKRNIMEQLFDCRPWCPTDLGPNRALALRRMAGHSCTTSEPRYHLCRRALMTSVQCRTHIIKEMCTKDLYTHRGRSSLPSLCLYLGPSPGNTNVTA